MAFDASRGGGEGKPINYEGFFIFLPVPVDLLSTKTREMSLFELWQCLSEFQRDKKTLKKHLLGKNSS
jgi:hypothetical protein